MIGHAVSGSSRGFIEATDGVPLHHRAWEARPPAAVILLVHGMFEHSGRYEEVGERLADRGFSVRALDHRGHGLSGGRRGHVHRFTRFLDDLDRFRSVVDAATPAGLPTFMLAHSLGGLVGLRYLQERGAGLAGAVISSPWLATHMHVPAWKRTLARALSPVLPSLPTTVRLDPEDLSRDPDRVRDYRDDPRIHRVVTPRLFTEVEQAMAQVAAAGNRKDTPLLFLLAGADRIVDTAISMAFARSLQAPNVEIDLLDGAYHEVLQDAGRDRLIRRIGDWIAAAVP